MWSVSLVVAYFSCMYTMFFVRKHTSRGIIGPHRFLKYVLLRSQDSTLLITLQTNLCNDGHVSIVQKILSHDAYKF